MSAAQFTAAACAEQAGSAIAIHLLNELLSVKTQREASTILEGALLDLSAVAHHRAAGGFAAVLVAVVQKGLKAEASDSTAQSCDDCICKMLEVQP